MYSTFDSVWIYTISDSLFNNIKVLSDVKEQIFQVNGHMLWGYIHLLCNKKKILQKTEVEATTWLNRYSQISSTRIYFFKGQKDKLSAISEELSPQHDLRL